MKKIILILFSILIIYGCNKEEETLDKFYLAEVVGYDLNCNTCLLQFPNDTKIIKKLLGESESDIYNSANLNSDDFKTGELIQVKVRLPETNEIRGCKTLFQSFNYCNIYVSDYTKCEGSDYIDTIELKYEKCVTTYGQASLCFDSILNDSRCPDGAICVWEGNAKIRLKLSITGIGYQFVELNTNVLPIDTTINHLNIALISLSPYPSLNKTIKPEDYKATLSVANLSMLKSNAQILSFNPDKLACSWGWKIKMNNDTIMSESGIIGNTVGYEISSPIDVYIQTGEKTRNCQESGSFDYYDIERIIKVQ